MPPQPGLLGGFAAGLVSLANFISKRLHQVYVDIIDLSYTSLSDARLNLAGLIADSMNDKLFVGITTTTASYQSALKVASITREFAPHAIIVFGGHHASADPETVLRRHTGIVDLVVIGEGERSLCDLINNHPVLTMVPGLAFLDGDKFVSTPLPKPLSEEELDGISILFGDKGLIGTPGKLDHVTYVSSRGCPLDCSFCAVGNERIRTKSVRAVARDVEQLLEKGYSKVALEDNFFAHSPRRTKELCVELGVIKRKYPNFTWDCQTRVESLAREETIPLLVEAGCDAVFIGVESFNPEHLTFLNKTKNPNKYLRQLTEFVVPRLLDNNIHCYINLQFGIPGETVDQGKQSSDVLRHLGRLASAAGQTITIFPQLYVVYPGTTNYHNSVHAGRFPADVFESFTEWESQQDSIMYWLGEHFAHGVGGVPEGILKPDLLIEGKYEIDADAICRISTIISSINCLPGTQVFNFGEHVIAKRTTDTCKLLTTTKGEHKCRKK